MTTEVKRTNWSRFVKRFNSMNQYRPATVRVKRRGAGEVVLRDDTPLMGIALAKKGRVISGIDLFTIQPDPERLSQPTIRVEEPVKILANQDESKNDNWLMVEGDDGTQLRIELRTDEGEQQYRSTVEKLAYTMYERRGHQCGHDIDDWLEAERLISQTATRLMK